MAGEGWTDQELRAATRAYLRMMTLHERDMPFQKTAFVRELLDGPLASRTSVDHRMQNISYVLEQAGRPWLPGYVPQANVGRAMAGRLTEVIAEVEEEGPVPLLPPAYAPEHRVHRPTGYWMLMCNPNIWNAEGWLRSGSQELSYTVSKHNRDEMRVGDLAVLRVAKRPGTKARSEKPLAIYAIFEVIDASTWRSDDNSDFWGQAAAANSATWRARLRLLANLVDEPVVVGELPNVPGVDLVREGYQSPTVSLPMEAFEAIVKGAGAAGEGLKLAQRAGSPQGARGLEVEAMGRTPRVRERISKTIERGPEGARVKKRLKFRCQACQALGDSPMGFTKRNGEAYAEAHHVMPVATLAEGALGEHNIMVLCAHHHRQAHFGVFDVIETSDIGWRIMLDDKLISIPRG